MFVWKMSAILWILDRNSCIFIQEIAFENVWKMAAILSLPQCVNKRKQIPILKQRAIINGEDNPNAR